MIQGLRLIKITISFLFIGFYVTGQAQISEDSVVNYSYYVEVGNLKTKRVYGAATGFILSHREHLFFITNYHVVRSLDKEKERNFISIWLRNKTDSGFSKVYLLIVDTLGNRKYSTYCNDKGGIEDVVAFHVKKEYFPDKAKLYTIPSSIVDTAFVPRYGVVLEIVGFPKGQKLHGWQPTRKLSIMMKSDPMLNLFYQFSPTYGMSGSPVYLTRNPELTVSLIGVNFLTLDTERTKNLDVGMGVKIKYVIKMIDEMIKQDKVNVQVGCKN